MNRLLPRHALSILAACSTAAAIAAPAPTDRVYTADQNSNTVSVIDPSTSKLLGQVRLGNARPDVLSPLYKGEINVHGLGFSPDHKTLVVVSNGSNSVAFLDTATNKVRGIAYVGRSPHEAFFTPDGKEVWAVVRGEDYISVIDPATYRETARIRTAAGPGMVLFHPRRNIAFVVHSFTAEVAVVDVATRKVMRRIPVASPFSPFLQLTPDMREVWLTHKDVGKVTRIDTEALEVKGVIDTGFITNHLAFAQTGRGTLAYVTVGGENAVKVYSTDGTPKLLATIASGALPHGIWASDDGSRVYVGLENGDAVEAIDTAFDRVVGRIAVGQAPQALVYVSNAAPAGDAANLSPNGSLAPVNIALKAVRGEGRGFVVARNLGLVDALEVSLYKLKPQTVYHAYIGESRAPVGTFRTNAMGMANATVIGPLREAVATLSGKTPAPARILVVEGDEAADLEHAVLAGGA